MVPIFHYPGQVGESPQLSGPLLEHLARRMRSESESEIERFGLRPRHVIALTLLRDFGERPQADLAEVLRIDPSNVVGLLNELEDAGLIERRRSVEDRRRHTVALTAAGEKHLDQVEEVLAAVEKRVLAALDAGQQAALYALLQRATAGAASCSGGDVPIISACVAED
jgi:DNA-binding MarR family transcriptional regulator